MNLDVAPTRSYPRGDYEEYHPYGSTAWWAGSSGLVSQKRYRFTGMERDEETGLQCHGVRYYAVWLGRWVSADPIGLGDGVNRFGYCHGGVIGGRDSTGLADTSVAAAFDAYRGWTEAARAGMIYGARDVLLTPFSIAASLTLLDDQGAHTAEKETAAAAILAYGERQIERIPGVSGSALYADQLLISSGNRIGEVPAAVVAGGYRATTSIGIGYAASVIGSKIPQSQGAPAALSGSPTAKPPVPAPAPAPDPVPVPTPTSVGTPAPTLGPLRSAAREIAEAGDHAPARNMRTIAVGREPDGTLKAGSSGGFDRGQRAKADQLGVQRVTTHKGLHAEENLMKASSTIEEVGTWKRVPCLPDEHDCAGQLAQRNIAVEH